MVLNKKRVFLCGDIHGNHRGLIQVLKKSKFRNSTDKLILIGDVCDGIKETKQVVDRLLKIKDLVFVRGNHDDWLIRELNGEIMGLERDSWLQQGGINTLKSYCSRPYENCIIEEMSSSHKKFFNDSIPYHTEDSNLFVHGGVTVIDNLVDQKLFNLMWDRDLFEWIMNRNKFSYYPPLPLYEEKLHLFMDVHGITKIFLGHSETNHRGEYKPVIYSHENKKVIALDTGAGSNGRLSLINIDTLETFQSDLVQNLYPDYDFLKRVGLSRERSEL